MNKIIFIILLLTFTFSESTFGQFNLDFSTGMNYSTCKFETFETFEINTKPKLGYFLAFGPNYRIKRVKFNLDFQYSNKGFEDDNSGIKYRFSYLDFISEIEYNIVEYLTIGVGINYGLKLHEYAKQQEGWINIDFIETIVNTDLGLVGKVKMNYNNMFGFVRYNIGIKDISELMFTNDNGESLRGIEQSNRNLQIGIGYRLGFTKD
jgi:hypothetical protein